MSKIGQQIIESTDSQDGSLFDISHEYYEAEWMCDPGHHKFLDEMEENHERELFHSPF